MKGIIFYRLFTIFNATFDLIQNRRSTELLEMHIDSTA